MSSNGLRILEALTSQARSFDELRSLNAASNALEGRDHLVELLEALEGLGLLEVIAATDAR